MKRVLFGIVWAIGLYFLGCAAVGGIAGGMAAVSEGDSQRARQIGANAGAKAVDSFRLLILAGAVALATVGSITRILPGTRLVTTMRNNAQMNKYLTIFLKSGAYFGGIMGVWFAFQHGNLYAGLGGGVAAGILFGFSMTLLTFAANRKLRKQGIDTSSSAVKQSRSLGVNRTKYEMFPVCKSALLSLKNSTFNVGDVETGELLANVGFSWKSFGEVVRVSIKPITTSKTLIEIDSKPSLPTTIVDYGKNVENVEAILRYLKREVGPDAVLP